MPKCIGIYERSALALLINVVKCSLHHIACEIVSHSIHALGVINIPIYAYILGVTG